MRTCGAIACRRYPQRGQRYVAGLRLCAARTDHHAAGSSLGTGAHVRERDDGAVGTARRARHALDGRLVVELDHLQLAIDVPAVVQACDRLLPGIAALAEADVRLVEAGLGGEDGVVELAAPPRDAGLDAAQLELVGRERRL